MVWVKIDDQFSDHPKVMQAGPMASWLYTCGLCYCGRYLTDGFIPAAQVRKLADLDNTDELAARLVEAGLWDRAEHGYMVHDYLDYNPTAEDVKAQREIASRRWAMNHDPDLRESVRARDGDVCRFCGKVVNWQDRKGPDGGTYDHVLPITAGGTETTDNIVVCCKACNSKKGARTPEQAGMTMRPAIGPDQDQIKTESSTNQAPKQDIPYPIPSPTTPTASPRAIDASTHLFALLDNAGVMIGSSMQSDEWTDILTITQDMTLIRDALRDAASLNKVPTAKYVRRTLERCLAEGCRPGKYAPRPGDAPTARAPDLPAKPKVRKPIKLVSGIDGQVVEAFTYVEDSH